MSDGILAAVDFSDITEQVLTEAVRLAKALNVPLRLLHVAVGEPDPGLATSTEVYCGLGVYWITRLRKQLEDYREECEADGLEVSATTCSGIPVKTILSEAERLEVAFLVLGLAFSWLFCREMPEARGPGNIDTSGARSTSVPAPKTSAPKAEAPNAAPVSAATAPNATATTTRSTPAEDAAATTTPGSDSLREQPE